MPDHKLKFERPLTRVFAESQTDVEVPPSDVAPEPSVDAATAMEETNRLLENLTKALADVHSKTESVTQELTELSVALSRIVVERLIGESHELQAKRISTAIQSALGKPEPKVSVFVNTTNFESVKQYFGTVASLADLDLSADDSVPVGDCRVSLNTHDLVSSLESQLDSVEAKLREALGDDN